MSGATTELNLRTAVDSDDNADYLTLDLANSLRTLDALFNNVTGHNHSSAHQGGPLVIGAAQIADGSINSSKIADGSIQTIDLADGSVTTPKLADGAVTVAKLKPPIDIPEYFRSTNVQSYPNTGSGLELYYQPGNGGVVQSYNRGGTVYLPLLLIGSTVALQIGGTPVVSIGADYTTTVRGPLTFGAYGTINFAAGMVLTQDANNFFYRATMAGNHFFQHNDGSYAGILCGNITASGALNAPTAVLNSITIQNGGTIDTGPAQYIRISQLTVTPGAFAAASASINGPLTVTGTTSLQVLTATRIQNAGAYYFANDAANITWDGVYIRPSNSIAWNTVGNQMVWPNGSYISGNSGYVQGSQAALKENVTPIPDSEAMIRVADPRMVVSSYNWPGDTRESLGFMAEDVAAVLPNYVIRDEDGTPAGYVPQELTAILWGALRQLDARVKALEAV